jgi:hypothetical protein
MNWQIGKRINDEILQNKRAEYGKEIVSTLSKQFTAEFGSSLDRTNLTRMIKFAEIYPDIEIVVTLSQQLNWSHSDSLHVLLRAQQLGIIGCNIGYARIFRGISRSLSQLTRCSILFRRLMSSKKNGMFCRICRPKDYLLCCTSRPLKASGL